MRECGCPENSSHFWSCEFADPIEDIRRAAITRFRMKEGLRPADTEAFFDE